MKLSRAAEDGTVEDGPFLSQAFRLVRWFPEVERRPRLRLSKMAVVAPADSGLAHAAAERDYLFKLAVPGRRTVDIVTPRGVPVSDLVSGLSAR